MKLGLIRQIICALSVIGTIAGNALANILPFNGQTTGDVSNSFDVLFVPAGYVFGIWGLLYITWCVFAVYQFLPSKRDDVGLNLVGWLFVLTGVANVGWLWLWHHERFAYTVIVMLCLLVLLIAIYLRLNVGRPPVSWGEKLCVHVPFSLYLAWISVATIANVTVYLSHIGWSGWGLSDVIWANTMMIVAAALGVIACLQRRDLAFVAVLLWALTGIANKQADVSPVFACAWFATGLLVGATITKLALDVRSARSVSPS
jgi:hypothetical protein